MVDYLTISPDGQTLATCSYGTIKLWNFHTGRRLRTPLRGVSLAFSPNTQTLVTGSGNGDINLWDLHTGKLKRRLEGHSGKVTSLAISPDGQALASADNTIKLWNLETGEVLRTLEGHSNIITSLAFSLDGKTLASSSKDRTVKVWGVR
jgi:WD40 repeat protein